MQRQVRRLSDAIDAFREERHAVQQALHRARDIRKVLYPSEPFHLSSVHILMPLTDTFPSPVTNAK